MRAADLSVSKACSPQDYTPGPCQTVANQGAGRQVKHEIRIKQGDVSTLWQCGLIRWRICAMPFTKKNGRRLAPVSLFWFGVDQPAAMSSALTPATSTGFFIASRRKGSPSSWLIMASISVVLPWFI